jgi:hypothetical protein
MEVIIRREEDEILTLYKIGFVLAALYLLYQSFTWIGLL